MIPDAIVIGAGFAGLSAATALADSGRRVLVLEARPSTGGRAASFADPATRERVDNGQHVMFGCYAETFAFLRRLGTDAHVYVQPRLEMDIVDRDGRASMLSCPALPAPLGLLAGLLRWPALPLRDRLTARRMRRPAPPDAAETVRQWLERCGQAPRLVDLLWEPLAVAALNQSIDEAAAGSFAAVVRQLLGPGPQDASLAIPTRPLDQLYAGPARAYVEARGGAVRTDAPVRVACDGGTRVLVRDEVLSAPVVISAVPWFALSDLFVTPPAELDEVLDAARRTDASPIVTVNLWLDRKVTERPFVGFPGRTFQWVFDKQRLFGDGASHLSLVSSGAAAIVGQSNAELAALAFGEIQAALPLAGGATVTRAVVVREKRATFSVAPGQPVRPGTATRIPGLFLAGDWIDTGLPSTIEGAVKSGHAAARAASQ